MPEDAPMMSTTLSCMGQGKVKSHLRQRQTARGGYVTSRMKNRASGHIRSSIWFTRTSTVSSYSSIAYAGCEEVEEFEGELKS